MTIIDKDHLPVPVAEMQLHRKTALTPMVAMAGPFTVMTREGVFHTKDGWTGFIAVDREGYPYAIATESYSSTYEPVV